MLKIGDLVRYNFNNKWYRKNPSLSVPDGPWSKTPTGKISVALGVVVEVAMPHESDSEIEIYVQWTDGSHGWYFREEVRAAKE